MQSINSEIKPEVSLVLSSGGARGIAHIGVIKELERQGYKIASISGSSIGAVIGSFYAAGYLDEFTEWVTKLELIDVLRLFDISISSQGFVKGEKVFNELKKIIPDQNIEDLPIPFAAIAVDVKTHKEVVFKTGSLYDAIRASVSIPSVLTPFKLDKYSLIDGGVLNPLPIDHVYHKKGNLLVAVDLNANIPYRKPSKTKVSSKKDSEKSYNKMIDSLKQKFHLAFPAHSNSQKKLSYFNLVTQSIEMMQERITNLTLQIHKPDMVVRIAHESCSVFEFHRAKEMIKYGQKQFKKEFNLNN